MKEFPLLLLLDCTLKSYKMVTGWRELPRKLVSVKCRLHYIGLYSTSFIDLVEWGWGVFPSAKNKENVIFVLKSQFYAIPKETQKLRCKVSEAAL